MIYNDIFLQNPKLFLRRNAVFPPNNAKGDQLTGLKKWDVEQSEIEGSTEISLAKVNADIRYMELSPHAIFKNTLALQISDSRNRQEQIPIFWLPWKSKHVVQVSIPESIPGISNKDYPKFFFTSGLSGCSVFVRGPSSSPTIFHAGIEGKITGDAALFWKKQLDIAIKGTGLDEQELKAEVNKHDYMDSDSQTINDYISWALTSGNCGKFFKIERFSNFGCVFGVRENKDWSFYMQENAMLDTYTYQKREDLVSTKKNGVKTYQDRATGQKLTIHKEEAKKEKRTLGAINLLPKRVWIYASKNQMPSAVCAKISEIYPKREWVGELKDIVKFHGKV